MSNAFRWLVFSFIALAVLISYFPSLFFPPRADQVVYLSETAHIHHPQGLILGCYDHNRHRIFDPGDELLFRPLLYALLGSEQVLFGHHFWAWQLLGLFAHLTLIWVLLRLLWHLTDPWLAFAGTWLFALSVPNYELVTWPHLSIYMFMMACMVAAIEQAAFCFEDQQVPWNRINRMLIYFFIACFTYETANIFVLWITGTLIITIPRMKGRLVVLIIPVIVYALFSYFNFTYVNHAHVTPGVTDGISMSKHISSIFCVSLWWLYEGIFNSMYHYILAIRTMFWPQEVGIFKPLALNNLQVILKLIILAAFLGLAWIARFEFFKKIRLLMVLLGMLFSYAAVILIGRSHDRALLETVRINTYFPYIFWVIVVIIIFLLLSAKVTKTRLQQWCIGIFVAASLFSGVCQGRKIYDMASWYSQGTNNNVLLITTLDLLIQEKKLEPHFSFYVDPNYQGNYPYGSLRKATDPPGKEYTFAELLYPQYFRPRESAKYKFLVKKTP